jgi:nickel-dependent lactate racemase
MHISVPLGRAAQLLAVPDGQLAGVCLPTPMPIAQEPGELIRDAIVSAMGRLAEECAPRRRATACIAVTDRTRSTPLAHILPPLLDQLNNLGIPDSRICVISGGGMHAPDARADLAHTLGRAVLDRVQTGTNAPDSDTLYVNMGTTGLGTPVEVHRAFAEADLKLGIINVNPCMLAGWSGGGKIVQPAVASRRSIYANHRHFTADLMKLRCASLMGIMPPENTVRADLEECAQIASIDLVINTVLDSHRRLVDLFCGDVVAAQRAAVDRMAPHVEVCLPQPVDVLVAAVGEPALEVSLFQGGSRVCGGADRYLNPGGTLVMVNACEEGIYEGFEHEEYRDWMRQMPTPQQIAQLVQDGAMGGEKGCVLFTFSWLLHEMSCRIVLVTPGMTRSELEQVHLGHAESVQEAVDRALGDYAPGASIGVMPYAGLVLPTLVGRT